MPLTLIPEWFMGYPYRPFGPDTSVGLLPMPHVLVYYAVFFAFGAIYHDCDDRNTRAGRLGRHWWLWGGLALGVIFPIALNVPQGRLLSSLLQVAYAWMMIFAFMGFFGRFVRQPNRAIRYLSDASYWLYLMHLPLLIPLQAWVRNWPLPALLKCALLCIAVTGSLLLVYDLVVRYTWVGAMLNGRKQRPRRHRELESAVATA
jgi:peptidoglycan/LPS O-acetylase OafA/YrhL